MDFKSARRTSEAPLENPFSKPLAVKRPQPIAGTEIFPASKRTKTVDTRPKVSHWSPQPQASTESDDDDEDDVVVVINSVFNFDDIKKIMEEEMFQ